MKKLIGALALAVTSTACQHRVPPTQAVGPAALATVVAAEPDRAVPAAPVVTAIDTAGFRAMAASIRPSALPSRALAALLQSSATRFPQVQNGFFGPARYRIEMIFTQVQRDSQQSSVYQIQGKSRYKKVITPFSGTITLSQVVEQPNYSPQEIAEIEESPFGLEAKNLPNMYTALGKFELREDSTQHGAGVYRGTVAVDLVVEDGSIRQQSQTIKTLTQGGGIKYAGTWTNLQTGQTQPVVWVDNILSYHGPQVFRDFTVGERDVDFNPKYAKLGWNTYWQNDEWWTASPKL